MQPFNSKLVAIVIIVLATGLTLLSHSFVRPVDCNSLCDAPQGAVCPAGACRAFEQRAGLPLPYQIDNPGGGSPTSGWGILGEEDLPNPFTFLLDVGFYSLLLWFIRYIVRLVQGKAAMEFLAILLPSGLLLVFLIAGYLFYQPFLGR
jgi:hypothetical protein